MVRFESGENEGADGVIHIGGNTGQNASTIITGNEITNNVTGFGTGGIKVTLNSDAVISDNNITNNQAAGDNSGGAIMVSFKSTADIRNNTISGNTATRAGAVINFQKKTHFLMFSERSVISLITENLVLQIWQYMGGCP